jgi:hypothetical protein
MAGKYPPGWSAALTQGAGDTVQQPVGIAGFGQAGDQPRNIGGQLRVSGNEQRGDAPAFFHQMPMQLDAAHARHLYVAHQALRMPGRFRVEELQGSGIGAHGVTAGSQKVIERRANGFVVIDYCNRDLFVQGGVWHEDRS